MSGGNERNEIDAQEITIFQEYLRIPSVHPNIDYGEWCVCDLYLKYTFFVTNLQF